MATENAPSVNGYGSQYGQPAELTGSTPSSHAPSVSQSSSTQAAQKADAQEIGWYFVEQYYTTLSKSPDRIHLFYSKKSQLVTGVEAEKVLPSVGTKVSAVSWILRAFANTMTGHQREDQVPRLLRLQSPRSQCRFPVFVLQHCRSGHWRNVE